MLYLRKTNMRLALSYFEENQLSPGSIGISPLPTPHPHPFSNGCGFGPPLPFTATSTWTWVDHPVSGLLRLTVALLRLGFPSAPDLQSLTSPASATRRTVLQKVRGSSLKDVPQLVNIWFQVLFHSPPGVLFTFPSQYYALSVTKEYLALRGGPRVFSQGSTCLDLLWIPPCQLAFAYGAFTLSGRLSQNRSARLIESIPRSEPQGARTLVWALPFSLAATHRITCCFLFLRLLRCFSSPGSLP